MQWFGGLLEQAQAAAPGLLGKFSSAPAAHPSGFQPPDSSNEIVFSPDKSSGGMSKHTDGGHHPCQKRQDFAEMTGSRNDRSSSFGHHSCQKSTGSVNNFDRVSSFATDIDGGYTGDEEHLHTFGTAFGSGGVSHPHSSASSSSPQRQAASPAAAPPDFDDGLITAPNGIGVNVRYGYGDSPHREDPYDSYRANDGQFEDVPPTTPSLQMPPEESYPSGYGGQGAPKTAAVCYSPPGTVGGKSGLSQLNHRDAPSPGGSREDDQRQRMSWQPGSIVEVYSSSASSWYVARVINIAPADPDDVLTVQFISFDAPKQKSIPRGDRSLVPLGSRGGPPDLPPGFQVRESQSRPGQQVFLDATTGVKYASVELAWSMHFERLAQNNSGSLEKTVAAGSQLPRFHDQVPSSRSSSSPLGTCAGSFSPGALPQVPEAPSQSYPMGDRTPLPSFYHEQPVQRPFMTEGTAPPSCRSDGPPALSLAELMNMKDRRNFVPPSPQHYGDHLKPLDSVRSSPSEWGQTMEPSMPSQRPSPPMSPYQSSNGQHLQAAPMHHAPSSTMGWNPSPPATSSSHDAQAAGSAMGTMGGKIALPSFGERPPTDGQAAYLQHEAAYMQNIVAEAAVAEAAVAPFADREVATSQAPDRPDPYSSMHGFSRGHAPSVPRRPPPVRSNAFPEMQAWQDDPFSQWRR